MKKTKDFGDAMAEQVDALHEYTIDQAPPALISVDGENRIVKKVLIGEDKIETYWDRDTYTEVIPDPVPRLPS